MASRNIAGRVRIQQSTHIDHIPDITPDTPGGMYHRPDYPAADQLTRWPGNHTYTYYGTGSMYEQWNDGMTALQKTYQYTPANLLSSVVHEDVAGDPASTMAWDADGNRISFTSSTGGTWQFVYDTTAGVPAVVEEVQPAGSVYYIREPGGELIASVSGTTSPVYTYYHFDGLGSTRLLTDASGTVTDEYTYDAWGKQATHTGATGQPYGFVGQLGYYTHWQDENLFILDARQFLQLGVRFYDVETGRFTQSDPADLEENPYRYCSDSPTALTDPKGLYGTTDCSYYAKKCKTATKCKSYYCEIAPYACKHFGQSKVLNCVRKCLQDCDEFYDCSVSGGDAWYKRQPHWCNVCMSDCHTECWRHCLATKGAKPPKFTPMPANPPGGRESCR